jgi:hypothetical protein
MKKTHVRLKLVVDARDAFKGLVSLAGSEICWAPRGGRLTLEARSLRSEEVNWPKPQTSHFWPFKPTADMRYPARLTR